MEIALFVIGLSAFGGAPVLLSEVVRLRPR